MIDPNKIKKFWNNRALQYISLPFESIANLEQDPENLQQKINEESVKVFNWLGSIKGKKILDLGAGVGQWSFRFAERGASEVLAVEYAVDLANIGREEAVRRKLEQVEFVVSAAEDFFTKQQFDLIYISGLFVYLNDEQAFKLLKNLQGFLCDDGLLMLRDGTAVFSRYEIDDKFSEHLEQNYSAIYRTKDEYIDAFSDFGFTCEKHENMFAEGHPLNKYPETRLHLFLFRKNDANNISS